MRGPISAIYGDFVTMPIAIFIRRYFINVISLRTMNSHFFNYATAQENQFFFSFYHRDDTVHVFYQVIELNNLICNIILDLKIHFEIKG